MVLEREFFEVVRKSPGRLFLYGEHFDSVMTYRPLFEKYFLPSFRELADILHSRGKYLACHGDADASDLLDLIAESGFDMCECFVCHPMVKCRFDRLLATVLSERQVILGVGDVVMPEAIWSRLEYISARLSAQWLSP